MKKKKEIDFSRLIFVWYAIIILAFILLFTGVLDNGSSNPDDCVPNYMGGCD